MINLLPEPSEIKRIRKRLGLTQSELAKLSGVNQSLIARIESGSDPRYSTIRKIFKALRERIQKREIKIEKIMNKKVIFINANDKIQKAARIMSKMAISQLPVLENGIVVGSLREKNISELLKRQGPNKEKIGDMKVRKFMEECFPEISKNGTLDNVIELLKYEPAVLVKENGKIVGIITKSDLMKLVE
ncbi:MAG: CBS domain-containing protein [Candidatus Aenigmarchaeota archaeon]|nr:CBS domain-containing protein [Candidatus Aenigmarchaeota archaeon]